jgi:hypothetical protein
VPVLTHQARPWQHGRAFCCAVDPAPVPDCIRTECGRAAYRELAQRTGFWATIRLRWFVLIAAIRDRHLPRP